MSAERSLAAANGFVAWLGRRGTLILVVSALTMLGAIYLVGFRLPLRADFSHLLPPDAPAVRDLRRLEARVQAQDTLLIIVGAADPAVRAAVASELAAKARGLPPRLVNRVEEDDLATRNFLRAHGHLFVPLADLREARDALRARIDQAKLEANPLFIDLEEEERAADAAATEQRLDDLRQRRRDAEAQLDKSSFVSADGSHQLIVVRTGFAKTDASRGKQLLEQLAGHRAAVRAKHPDVDIGFAGGVVPSVAEHAALVEGMVVSGIVTAVLVGLVLILYFRSFALLMVLSTALVVATTAAFGAAALTVGHLNAATAFLGAIIAGNGVNYGVLLIARYLEERRQLEPEPAMAEAIAGTLRPTLVASLGAAIAYGSLAVTSFRGFADFAVIGSIGMLLCWIASYTLLPVLVLRFAARPRLPHGRPIIGSLLAWLLAFRHPGRVVVAALALSVLAGAVTYRYVANDPFEYNIKNLRSDGPAAIEAQRWMDRSDAEFGRGIAGQTFIAVDRLAEVPEVVAALEKIDAPGRPRTIGRIRSILELVPPDQAAKLAELSEIRTMLDDDALEALDDEVRAELLTMRPPDDLAAISPDNLPEELAVNLRERDGRVGLLIGVRPDPTLDEWNGKDLIRFASAVRRLELADGRTVTTSGASVVFADIVTAIERDGLRVTAVATLGLILMVLLVVGRNLRSLAVLVATGTGALGLVAACATLGIKVNFLDFVALPITLGLGVDYAINIAHRHHGEDNDPVETLRTSGSAVFLCSVTTIIGYGSLLVSQNLAIKGFGLASLIGEISCLITALVLVPAIVSMRRRPAATAPAAPLDAAA